MDLETVDWKVKLNVFEGPLDLLLYLIKSQEVDIYQVELGKVCDQYLAYLEALRDMELEVAGEFLVIAATLVYIKSRTLLPEDQQLPADDEEDAEDPRWELIRQLVEYKKFKEAAAELENLEELREKLFFRDAVPDLPRAKDPGLGEVGVFDLVKAFQRILQRARERDGYKEIHEDKFTVSEKIEMILNRIQVDEIIPFADLFLETCSRTEIVVTFLAVLELVRLKQIKARQSDAFGEIELVRATAVAPLQPDAEEEGGSPDEQYK